ncbi:MAG TPA: NnrS family protein [Kiritimatiellia bacterium]|nr:NnrS family protein [Kiritimatiellia bacterium]HMP35061.1 NnrS family protein [Kiritimatiellia bacterium]
MIQPSVRVASPAASGPRHPAIFNLGFRIFFFAGATWAVVMIGVWLLLYAYGLPWTNHFAPGPWHGREMLFGFAGAVIAGFLLTAPGNWTGATMPSGGKLAALFLFWLAGRLVTFAPNFVPASVMLVLDAAFFPVLGLYLFQLLLRFHLVRNLFFPVLLLGMGAANALTYGGYRTAAGQALGTELMLALVVVVIAIMGGRVIPGFTHGRYPQGSTRNRPALNLAAMIMLIGALAADLAGVPAGLRAGLFGAAALLHAARLCGWYTREIWSDALTWVLHLAYGWLVVGLALHAAWSLGHGNSLLARHAITVGTIGTITLGMMCRVTIGHTGRAFVLPHGTVSAFVLITLAALTRVGLPLIAPSAYLTGVKISAVLWMAAFSIYLVQYGPMLFKPRADGRPG